MEYRETEPYYEADSISLVLFTQYLKISCLSPYIKYSQTSLKTKGFRYPAVKIRIVDITF